MITDHKKGEEIIAAAQRRLTNHMNSLDPSTVASAEMSAHKADGTFKDALEALLRECLTLFHPAALVEDAIAEVDGP